MLTNEHVVTFAEGAEHLPRPNGKKIHPSALWRWGTKGVRGVKLEVLLLGGRYVTSIEAIERFGRALAATGLPSSPPPPRPRTNAQRDRAIKNARANLERAGI